MIKRFAAVLGLALFAGGAAQAAGPSEGDLALFHTGAFTSSQTYNLGYMFSNELMGYGTLGFSRVSNGSSDTSVRIGAGARYYLDILGNGNVATFLDGSIEYEDGAPVPGAPSDDVFRILFGFGAEVFLATRLSVGARIGLLVYENFDNAGSAMSIGSTDAVLNIYFGG